MSPDLLIPGIVALALGNALAVGLVLLVRAQPRASRWRTLAGPMALVASGLGAAALLLLARIDTMRVERATRERVLVETRHR